MDNASAWSSPYQISASSEEKYTFFPFQRFLENYVRTGVPVFWKLGDLVFERDHNAGSKYGEF